LLFKFLIDLIKIIIEIINPTIVRGKIKTQLITLLISPYFGTNSKIFIKKYFNIHIVKILNETIGLTIFPILAIIFISPILSKFFQIRET
jgi:hypothetical protein